jgi:hypothetical protein
MSTFNKPLFLNVKCLNGEATDRPDSCFVFITSCLKTRILSLQSLIKANDLYTVNEFNYEPLWSHELLDLSEGERLMAIINKTCSLV